MAIDDSTNYTLTGAQVKDLAARIKAGGGGMIVYVDASFESPSSITNVFSDSGLTTVADWEDMADVILAGGTVIAVYDNGLNKHQYVELVSVTINDNVAVGKRFAGVISSGVGETSPPLTIFLYYNDSLATPRWFAEGASTPTVNDATLTIQHNGTNVQTFTANQSTNATANIETIWADDIAPATPVPPITSELIDWPTMEHWTIALSSNTTVTQGSSYDYVDVPGGSITANMTVGGVYLVFVNASVRCQGGSTDCYARVVVNGSNQVAVGVSNNPAAGTFAAVSSAQLFTPSQASNAFKLQIGGGRANSDYMIAGGLISSVQIIRIA